MGYNNLEQKLIKDGNMSFFKMLIEKDIKSYKYEILNEDKLIMCIKVRTFIFIIQLKIVILQMMI